VKIKCYKHRRTVHVFPTAVWHRTGDKTACDSTAVTLGDTLFSVDEVRKIGCKLRTDRLGDALRT